MDSMTYSPEYACFLENALETSILEHDALNAIGIYEQLIYMEDGEETPASKGVFEHIKAAILKILDSIQTAIDGAIDFIHSKSKKRLTAEEYMQSNTGQYQLSCDVENMMKAVDNEYLQSRKFVMKVSKLTKQDAEKIAGITDRVNSYLHDNRFKLAALSASAVEYSVVQRLQKSILGKMKDVQKCKDETQDLVNKMNPKDPNAKESKFALAFVKSLSAIGNAYIYMSNVCVRATPIERKMVKRSNKASIKEANLKNKKD